jgi:hypothetical protein
MFLIICNFVIHYYRYSGHPDSVINNITQTQKLQAFVKRCLQNIIGQGWYTLCVWKNLYFDAVNDKFGCFVIKADRNRGNSC